MNSISGITQAERPTSVSAHAWQRRVLQSWSVRLVAANAGFLVTGFLPSLPNITLCLFLLGIVLCIRQCIKRSLLQGLCVLLVCLITGLTIATWRSQSIIDQQIPHDLENKTVWITGWADGLSDLAEANQDVFKLSFYIKRLSGGSCVNSNGSTDDFSSVFEGKSRLSWRPEFQEAVVEQSPQRQMFESIRPGDQFCIQAKLKRPRGLANPAGYDYHLWLLSEGFVATGFIVDIYPLQDALSPTWLQSIKINFDLARYQLRSIFAAVIPERRNLAAILALSIGDDHLLDDRDWSVLKQTGTLHLLVISGLHVGLVAALAYWFGHGFARCVGAFRGRYFISIPVLCSVSAALIYALLAGFSLPTQRAMIMVVVASLLLLTGRVNQVWFGYWLSMLLVLFGNPLSVHQTGFLLSFSVVLVILTTLSTRKRLAKKRLFISLQTRIFLLMLVPLILITGSASASSWWVNVVAIPYISVFLVPLTLLSCCLAILTPETLLFDLIIQLTDMAIGWFWSFLDIAAAFDLRQLFSYEWSNTEFFGGVLQLSIGSVPTHNWVFGILLLLALLLPIWSMLLRALLIASILIVLLFPSGRLNPLKIVVFDVGQGFSAFISSQVQANSLQQGVAHTQNSMSHHLYDTGPRFGETSSALQSVVAPYFKFRGIAYVDHLIVSHGDQDHAYLAERLGEIADVQIGKTLVGEPHRFLAPAQQCFKGQSWYSGQTYFEVLWPDKDFVATKSNDSSCVLLVSHGGYKILFAGDISKSVEWQLEKAGLPNIDVLMAAHHGSKSSSSLRFLYALQPKHVVFSSGFGNSYHHPSDKVIQRIQQHLPDTQLWNTASDGAITITIDRSNQLLVNAYRKNHKRFWYALD